MKPTPPLVVGGASGSNHGLTAPSMPQQQQQRARLTIRKKSSSTITTTSSSSSSDIIIPSSQQQQQQNSTIHNNKHSHMDTTSSIATTPTATSSITTSSTTPTTPTTTTNNNKSEPYNSLPLTDSEEEFNTPISQQDLNQSKSYIQSLSESSIHKICSEQVIISLTSVVKELIENSLDAKSTFIEIKFVNMGLESIEVIDNGIGISKNNFKNLVKKHHTSKLSTLHDLNQGHVETFGFRGEALSSICCMSKLSICTRPILDQEEENDHDIPFINSQQVYEHLDENNHHKTTFSHHKTRRTTPSLHAYYLQFDHSQNLVQQDRVHRSQYGTTVKVSELFKNFPVRFKELERNIKREFSKCMNMIQSYALASEGITFHCVNMMTCNSSSLSSSLSYSNTSFSSTLRPSSSSISSSQKLLITHGKSMKDNIVNIFTLKEFKKLMVFHVEQLQPHYIQVNGYISKQDASCGRSSSDRQFLYINKRPIDLPKLSRCINDIYKQFSSRNQYPIYILNIQIDPSTCDINVTPDKRRMYLLSEPYIIQFVKYELEKLYSKSNEMKISISDSSQLSSPVSGSSSFNSQQQIQQQQQQDDENDSENEDGVDENDEDDSENENGVDNEQKDGVDSENEQKDGVDNDQWNGCSNGNPSSLNSFEKNSRNHHNVKIHNVDSMEQFVDTSSRMTHHQEGKDLKKKNTSSTNIANAQPLSSHQRPKSSLYELLKDYYEVNNEKKEIENDELIESSNDVMSDDENDESIENFNESSTNNTLLLRSNSFNYNSKRISYIPTFNHESKKLLPSKNSKVTRISFDSGVKNIHQNDDKSLCRDVFDASTNVNIIIQNESEIIERYQRVLLMKRRKFLLDENIPSLLNSKPSTATFTTINTSNGTTSTLTALTTISTSTLTSTSTSTTTPYTTPTTTTTPYTTPISTFSNHHHHHQNIFHSIPNTHLSTQQQSEKQLTKLIKKDDFSKMTIIGQFNKSFIIALFENELIILDQHACDEKFNYERFKSTLKIFTQPLIVPQKLDLTLSQQFIVRDHLQVFEKNGFKIRIEEGDAIMNHYQESLLHDISIMNENNSYPIMDHSNSNNNNSSSSSSHHHSYHMMDHSNNNNSNHSDPMTNHHHSKIEHTTFYLTSLPYCKNITFTLQDFEELISILSENISMPPSIKNELKPSKVNRILASKACRSSVMFGQVLNRNEMEKIVRQLDSLEQPWNCPHGRSTLRIWTNMSTFLREE